jgi:enterochelin esterase-like enzyme
MKSARFRIAFSLFASTLFARSVLRVFFTAAALGLALLSPRAIGQAPAAGTSVPETPAAQTAPVPLVSAPAASPVVSADGSATFHLVMPSAKVVELHLEGRKDPLPMAPGADGAWTVTVPGLAPEYYSYTYAVDGTEILDPHNTTVKTSFFTNNSVFLVPGQPPMPWEVQDVPHGVVSQHFYASKIVGIQSQYYVYTPPGFDPHSGKKYPVLYLLHGYSDEPSAWTAMGKANVILDNLIAAGKAKPMMVVMPWGYGDMRMITSGWAAWRDPALVSRNFSRFGDALEQEVMPLVEQQYPLSGKREEHAIAGLSMGGAETLLVGLNHVDQFAYIGSFSAGGLGSDHFEPFFPGMTPLNGAELQSRLKLLWIACGTEDGLFTPNQKFIAWLTLQGMRPVAIETPGMHAWMVWRGNLAAFAPLLFQDGPK